MYRWFLKPKAIVFTSLLLTLMFIVACGGSAVPEATTAPQGDAAAKADTAPKGDAAAKDDAAPKGDAAAKGYAAPKGYAAAKGDAAAKDDAAPKEAVKQALKEVAPGVPAPAAAAAPPARKPWLAWTAKGKYGGVLRIINTADPDHWDMHLSCCNPGPASARDNYNLLVMYDPTNHIEIIGDLAESWEWADDGRSLTFRIHGNAKWSDGVPVTAEDVKFSLDRMVMTGVPRPRTQNIAPYYASSEVIDPTTIKVNLRFPHPAAFLPFLAIDYMTMVPKHVLEGRADSEEFFDVPENIVGSGAYLFKSYERSSSIEYEKNPNYWKEGLPFLDGTKTFLVRDRSRSVVAMETGQIDLVNRSAGLTQKDALALKASVEEKGIGTLLQKGAASAVGLFQINWTRPPLDDPRVRRAVYLAIDRLSMVEVITLGFGDLGTPFFSGTWMTSSDEEIATWPGFRYVDAGGTPVTGRPHGLKGLKKDPRDIEEAKDLLAAAGHPDGFKAIYHTNAGGKARALIVQQSLKAIGIDVELKITDQASVIAAEQAGDFTHFNSVGYAANIIDPDDLFIGIFLPGGPRNSLAYEDPRIREIFEKERSETDQVKRQALVREAEEIWREGEGHSVALYWIASWLYFVNNNVKNYVPPIASQSGFETEHIWLEP